MRSQVFAVAFTALTGCVAASQAQVGIIALGDLPGADTISCSTSVSADGSVVVGFSTVPAGAVGGGGYVWTEALGMRSVYEVLVSMGQADAVEGWTIGTVSGVSADGTVIFGEGTNPSGDSQLWIATIPDPAGLMGLSVLAMAISRRSLAAC